MLQGFPKLVCKAVYKRTCIIHAIQWSQFLAAEDLDRENSNIGGVVHSYSIHTSFLATNSFTVDHIDIFPHMSFLFNFLIFSVFFIQN